MHLQFCSGLNRPADFAGVLQAGLAPGVQVHDLNSTLLETVVAHLRSGGDLFVDSGALPAFIAGTEVDFDCVMQRYATLAQAAQNPSRLLLVAPDKVGDQTETLRLLSHHASRLGELAAKGVTLLVPVQGGTRSLSEVWNIVKGTLPGVCVHPAIPMRAKAIALNDLLRFIADSSIRRVHLLGTSNTAIIGELQQRFHKLRVTADANRIRAYVGQGRPITEFARREIDEAADDAWRNGSEAEADSTEFTFDALNTPGILTPSEIEQIAEFLARNNEDRRRIRTSLTAGESDAIHDWEAEMIYTCLLPEIHRAHVARNIGPAVRTRAIAAALSPSRAKSNLITLSGRITQPHAA